MIYGIDLGTTNSIIALYDKYMSGLVPSIVNKETGCVGESEREAVSTYRSFKTQMSVGLEGKLARKASAYVLRELKKLAGVKGEMKAVISVPADFNDSQRKATIQAAESANIKVVSLINEPTAAALYLGKDERDVVVVFDLGGGTFDVSIIDNRGGFYDVQLSHGDTHCGGDDLDKAIKMLLCKRCNIVLAMLTEEQELMLDLECTNAKILMQQKKTNIHIDLSEIGYGVVTFRESDYIALMKQTFSKCLSMTQRLVNQGIDYGSKYTLLFVGGSTRCPYLREWVTEELGNPKVPTDYNPDFLVAQGAAYYAHLIEEGLVDTMVSEITKGLSIVLDDNSCARLIEPNSKVPCKCEEIFTVPTETSKLIIELAQGSAYMASDNQIIGKMVYDFGRVVSPGKDFLLVTVNVQRDGVIILSGRELLKEPKEITLSAL